MTGRLFLVTVLMMTEAATLKEAVHDYRVPLLYKMARF